MFLAFGQVVGVGEKDVVAKFARAVFDGKDDAGEDGVGDGGDNQAKNSGGLAAQPLRKGIGDVTHLLGERLDARLGRDGNVRGVPQGLRDGHHGHTGLPGNVF